MNADKIKSFPISIYLGFVLTLTLGGILVSGYLSISHYRVYTDVDYASFCAISKAINCDTVSQSPYSIFLGIPVPFWGVIGYVFMLISLFISFDIKSKKLNNSPTLFCIGLIYSIISIGLGILSAFKIHSYCIMCIITYGINFILLYMIWLIRRRFEKKDLNTAIKENIIFWQSNKSKAFYYSPLIIGTIMIMVFMPNYWNLTYTGPGKRIRNTGITADKSPWIGAENPKLTITEYSDYMCFQCKKMHFFLRNLIDRYPDKIRLVHKHFPMDKRFNPIVKGDIHPGSGFLSLIAIYAAKENKFWELNDFLYHYNMSKGTIDLQQISQKFNLDFFTLKTGIHERETKRKLQKDILSGLKRHVIATPSYVINDKVYTGQIPPDILNFIRK